MVLILLTEHSSESDPREGIEGNVPNTREIADDLDVELLEQFRITYTRALQNLRSAERARAQNDVFPCPDDGLLDLVLVSAALRWYISDSDRLVALKDDTRDPGVGAQVQVVLNVHDAVDVG